MLTWVREKRENMAVVPFHREFRPTETRRGVTSITMRRWWKYPKTPTGPSQDWSLIPSIGWFLSPRLSSYLLPELTIALKSFRISG
jgi:hypothetical protein